MRRMLTTEKINRLYDYAVAAPDGFTIEDVRRDLGWRRSDFNHVVNRLRKMFGTDDINLVCSPQGMNEPWLYKLVGNTDETKVWQDNRLGDAEERINTIRSIARSTVNMTDGRTTEGQRARIIDRSLGRLLEDLAELSGKLL